LRKKDGKNRLKIQTDNFEKIAPKIKQILDREIKDKGKIIKVTWVGRQFIIEQTSSDVDAEHKNHTKTRFSVKSIEKQGTGTLKNLGLKNIQDLYHFDFSSCVLEMWKHLRGFVKKKTKKDGLTKGQIKKLVRQSAVLNSFAQANGRIYQKFLNTICLSSFNKLTNEEKRKFINFILGANDPDLYVIIANETGVIIYKPNERVVGDEEKIEARNDKESDCGYLIYVNNIPTYRVQTNNTNGIGISAFCQRIFLV
jgi:hypothetical protein